MPEPRETLNKRERPADMKPKYGMNATVRQSFEAAFGYDPSDPRDSVNASIPQALAMMNGVRINLAVRANDDTMLGRLLNSTGDNSAVVEELYLRTLSREPTDKEKETALQVLHFNEEPLSGVRRLALGIGEFFRILASKIVKITTEARVGQEK